jgi:hypothetical protein
LIYKGENYRDLTAVIEVVGMLDSCSEIFAAGVNGNSGRTWRKTTSMKSIGG